MGASIDKESLADLMKVQEDLFNKRQAELKEKENGGVVTIKRGELIRAKVKTFARMNYMCHVLRKEAELVTNIKALNPTGKLDLGVLLGGHDEMVRTYLLYREAREKINKSEGFPHNSPRHSFTTKQRLGQ